MRRALLLLAASIVLNTHVFAQGTAAERIAAGQAAAVRVADGFQIPVGKDGEGYYKARGYRPNGHLGEDWNGVRGGDTDLGDPVYATANGVVVFARDYHVGWGNVIILRHAYFEGAELRCVDSLYGHLLEMMVREGDQATRGQQIGKIGNNSGQYDAHLHFEMRKNVHIGMFRSSFPRDLSCYWDPTEFILAHRALPGGERMAAVPINTFPVAAPPSYGGPAEPEGSFSAASVSSGLSKTPSSVIHRTPFKIDRFEDLRGRGFER